MYLLKVSIETGLVLSPLTANLCCGVNKLAYLCYFEFIDNNTINRRIRIMILRGPVLGSLETCGRIV